LLANLSQYAVRFDRAWSGYWLGQKSFCNLSEISIYMLHAIFHKAGSALIIKVQYVPSCTPAVLLFHQAVLWFYKPVTALLKHYSIMQWYMCLYITAALFFHQTDNAMIIRVCTLGWVDF
jgi:hypothetical protein